MREPRNRAERRAAAKAERRIEKLVQVAGRIGVETRYRVINADGVDVTEERVKLA